MREPTDGLAGRAALPPPAVRRPAGRPAGGDRQLTPPAPSRQPVLRPRLLSRLQRRFRQPLTVLLAGPGFGKTTVLAQAVAENRLDPHGLDVWLTCTPHEAAVSVLAASLHAALDIPVEPPADPQSAARVIADALWSRAPQDVALLLDDAHHVTAGSPGHQLLVALLAVLPENGHLVIASRPPSPLPLARLLAQGQVDVVPEEAFAFDEQELLEFADLRDADAGVLHGVAGWPALAELSAATGQSHVAAFLWEELLAGLPEERRRVLAALAAVGGADDDLAAALLGRPVDLARALTGLPLVSRSDGWWSLHPLWGAALAPELPADERSELLRRAGEELAARGRLHEAMTLLQQARAWDDVRDLLVQACGGSGPLVPADVLRTWLGSLPGWLRESPEARLVAGIAAKTSDPDGAAALLQGAAADLRGAYGADAEFVCLLHLIQLHFWRNDVAGIRSVLTRCAELAEQGCAGAGSLTSLGLALLAADPLRAQEQLDRTPLIPDGPLAPLADWLRGHLLVLTLGQPEEALAACARALERAPATLRSTVECDELESLRLLGRLDEALERVPVLQQDLAAALVRSPRHLTAVTVLRSFVGDVDGAAAVLPELRAAVRDCVLTWAPVAEAVSSGACAVAAGDEPAATAALQQVLHHPLGHGRPLLRVSPASLPLTYVLLPETRAEWDGAPLLGCHQLTRNAARALVGARNGSLADLSSLPLPSAAALRGQLPVPWATELAVALVAVRREEGTQLLELLQGHARPTLRQLTRSAVPAVAAAAVACLPTIPPLPTSRLEIDVLGPTTVRRDGQEVLAPELRRERVRYLLGYLVTRRRAARTAVAAELWPDLEDSAAARNLRVTLNYLNRVLEPDRADGDAPYFLRTPGVSLELHAERLEVDAWAFCRFLKDAAEAERLSVPSKALEAYLLAVGRYRGDYLADLPGADWAAAERDRLRERFVAAAVRAGQLLLARRDHEQAEELAYRALAADPWTETAYQLLIATHLHRGDRSAAMTALQRCSEMLAELGVQASPATRDLHRRVHASDRPALGGLHASSVPAPGRPPVGTGGPSLGGPPQGSGRRAVDVEERTSRSRR